MTAPTTPSPERQPADAGGGLLPCPWCGGELYVSVQDIDNFIGHVECGGCDMRGPISEWKYEDPEEAKADAVERWNAAWNRRTGAPQAQPDARAVEALRRMERNPVSFSHAASQLARETLQSLSAPAADDGWRPSREALIAAIGSADRDYCDLNGEPCCSEEDGRWRAHIADAVLALHPAAPTDEVGKS